MSQQHKLGTTATTVSTSDGMTRVTFYHTDVVRFNAEKIILDSGGWKTATTKTRMNQASNQFDLGFSVFQKDHEWFVEVDGKPFVFVDGMEIAR